MTAVATEPRAEAKLLGEQERDRPDKSTRSRSARFGGIEAIAASPAAAQIHAASSPHQSCMNCAITVATRRMLAIDTHSSTP